MTIYFKHFRNINYILFNSRIYINNLIFYVLQIFSLMIYLEIIELNFCNLNKNTRRNIKSRAEDDLIQRLDSINSNNFEEEGGYIVGNIDNNSLGEDSVKIELNEIKGSQDFSEDN